MIRSPTNTPALPGGLPFDATQLSFSQSPVASAGSVAAKLQQIISVKDAPYNAVGDGVTDDTAAVVAFLTAISGKAGYMPAGTYKVTSTLSLTKNTLLFGDGANASIISYTGSGVAVQAVGSSDNWKSIVRDIKITTSTGTHGLRLKDLADFTVEGAYITGFSSAGVHLTGTAVTGMCICVRLLNNWILSNTGDGILADNVNAIHQIAIHGNRVQGNTGIGINIATAGFAWSILGNDIEGNGGTCELKIDGGSCSGVDVGGNYLESSSAKTGGTILVANTGTQNGVSIHGNYLAADVAITNAITLGVSAFVDGVSVFGNNFSGSYTNAVSPAAVRGGVIGPNKCNGSIVHIGTVGGSTTGLRIFNADNRVAQAYSASMTINAVLADIFDITDTNGVAFTINAPTNPSDDRVITITLRNTSGGALGAATWDAVFKMSAWTNPATGFSRSITFKYNGTNWVQISQTGVDVPN